MNINYKEFLEKVKEKLEWVTDEVDFLYPHNTVNGLYKNGHCGYDNWTNGFYGGIIWYMYLLTKDEKYLNIGKKCSAQFDRILEEYMPLHHDVGFQFLDTNVADYIITGDEKAKVRALHAANVLAGRFNPVGKFIRAWNDNPNIDAERVKTGYVIIDCMMNIPLLFWAGEITGDPRYKQLATIHADTVIKHFIREDGSSNHIVDFDAETGEVYAKPAGQGYAEGSAWTRGQGWAIYGFAMVYHYTGDKKYLDVAKKVARYFMDHTDTYVPIDFAQPAEPRYEDNSAAAITACGILEIMKYVDEEEKAVYADFVNKLMDILYRDCDFSHDDQGILQKCSDMYHSLPDGIHHTLIYGDFYLLEALMRLNGGDALYY